MLDTKTNIIAQLQKDLLLLQGFKPAVAGNAVKIGWGQIDDAFPNKTFPLGAVHEFICNGSENGAASGGFMSGLIAPLMQNRGACLWISSSRTIFPPALKSFGIEPHQVIFVDLQKEKDVIWATEEALKCGALAAVVGEIREISFTASRRLQLAVEQSQVTGFIFRNNPRNLNTTACVSRWKITPLPSETEDGMPGIGFPKWNVELLKVRNGRPGSWQVEWAHGRFRHLSTMAAIIPKNKRKQDEMQKRFVSIWFRHLTTDWFTLRQPALRYVPFVLSTPQHGRMVISAANEEAQALGIESGMVLADARAIIPGIEVMDDKPELYLKLLDKLAKWCIRFTPVAAIDPPDGLILDVTGCTHLWGGDTPYLTAIIERLEIIGYGAIAAMADTIGAAWAIARHAPRSAVIGSSRHVEILMSLPSASLRLEIDTIERLQKLGLRHVKDFMSMPRTALRKRFGQHLLQRLDQALGREEEPILPVIPVEPYQERLPCLEPIVTATGIEIALQRLLEALCMRLQQEQKGLRSASFKGYRMDGKIEEIIIGTIRPSTNVVHLFKLFEIRLQTIEPALGIELFILDAPKVEDLFPLQEKLWEGSGGLLDNRVSELIDRLAGRLGADTIHRYIPDEHHWPERSLKPADSLNEQPSTTWRRDKSRPLQLLTRPEPIDVAAPIPDYPPMLFRYKGKLHTIKKADGPERIEREWWLEEGEHRDYYCVEDEEGYRYWVFRSGHYSEEKSYQWFIYGFFA